MNEGAAAVAELAVNDPSAQAARSPELSDVEQFDNILSGDNAVQAVNFEDAHVGEVNGEFDDGVVNPVVTQDAVSRTTDAGATESLVPQTAQYDQFNYQVAEIESGNPIIENLADTLQDIDKRQDSVMEKMNVDWFDQQVDLPTDGSLSFEDRLELVWKMQQSSMEVQAWAVEVNMMTTSVSKSTSGVQTLFKSSG